MTAAPVNVAAHLSRLAGSEPDRPAVILPGFRSDGSITTRQMTFRELDLDSGHIAAGLASIGITPGTRTALMVPPSLDFISLTFALFKLGAVPVLIDPGMGIRNLGKCLGEAAPAGFIGIPKAHVARRLLRWSRESIKHTVTTGSRLFGGAHSLARLRDAGRKMGPLPARDARPEEMAAILFTSGSTGVAKGVVYPHRIFAAQVEQLKQLYGITPGEIDLCTFPLFALFAPALGMTAIIPEMDPRKPAEVDAAKIVRTVHHFRVTNMFGSPALINRVGRHGLEHQVTLPTVRRVISAGAPVAASVIERFTKMLNPGVQVFTPYGATESLPVANIGSDTILGETRARTERGLGVCVGHPAPGMRARIIRITDEPIARLSDDLEQPAGEIGEIVVNGPVVTTEYFGRPAATALAKMHDAEGALWHRMGDVGYLDSQGRLWFCGRKSHRVITENGTLFTIPVEAIFNTHPKVFRTALVGVRQANRIVPVVCVELEKEVSPKEWPAIEPELRILAGQFEITRSINGFLRHPAFPVDIRHNAKIFREKLAVWASKQPAGAHA